MDLEALRREYVFGNLSEQDLDDNPFRQFDIWFADAVGAGIELADVMTVATASPAGVPTARMVVLRGVDERGFVFYTDYRSAKSRDLLENPRAALVFYWRELGRQIRIAGAVQKVSSEESARYFHSRPLESRLAALSSRQSEVIPDRKVLEERYEALKAEYPEGDLPYPDNWGGFRVSPDEFEFWQGRERRLHDRIRYRRDGGVWVTERLSP
ncbi:MAG: pyridoxamine 5'-phosphate oxidase [Gemmatimonadetes bacterium]|nr:pyridoxamine 5'-phosphate oxidase [Gemmatimonadota bacterium]